MTPHPPRPAGRADVANGYRLILGRRPESEAVVGDKLGLSAEALVRELAGAAEFEDEVWTPLLSGGPVGGGRFPDHPSPDLKLWAATWLVQDRRLRKALLEARDWTKLWSTLLGDTQVRQGLGAARGDGAAAKLVQALAGRTEGLGLESCAATPAPRRGPTREQGLVRLDAWRRAEAAPTRSELLLREEIEASGLFDAGYYWSRHPDVTIDPLSHYLQFGWRQDRRPNARLDPTWYRATYADVGREHDVLVHYLRYGASEDRDPGPDFSTARYRRAQHLAPGVNPLAHALVTLEPLFRRDAGEAVRLDAAKVLIVAELSIAQCRRYRVEQKVELLRHLGFGATVLAWTDQAACRGALHGHSAVIFYRTPGSPGVLALIEEAKSLSVPVFWEVDDLIFDGDAYIRNDNLKALPDAVHLNVLRGVPEYRKAMLACGAGIASTPPLAEAMRRAGLPQVFVVRNALDSASLDVTRRIAPDDPEGEVIVYGSGSDTHDADFALAAPAIVELLEARPQLRFLALGDLRLPAVFNRFPAQVERRPKTDYETYMRALAGASVSIAPLQASAFNDAKSSIKFLEAALLGVPSVCSDSPSFREAVAHGRTGFLATSSREWRDRLRDLLDDPALRRRMGDAARASVMERFAPERVAEHELAAVVGDARRTDDERPAAGRLRVLVVNVFFRPRSFGGATIVAEAMVDLLNARGDTEVGVFTGLPDGLAKPYATVAYEAEGVPVIGVVLPETGDPACDFDDPGLLAPFREALARFDPDVVHFHAIQRLGLTLTQVCREQDVPYVVTAHDAWWLCGRQFMVDGEGRDCGQHAIDLNRCFDCVPDAGLNLYRASKARDALSGASAVLTPSRGFADLYAANGAAPGRLAVNRNGVAAPGPIRRATGGKLVFGFVGGNAAIKGAHVLRKVFTELQRDDYELVLVDNTRSLGFSSVREEDWPIRGDLRIVPAYEQRELDAFFSGLDVLLFPTRWRESFGLTVREALVRDVWVIASDAGGVAEDIVAGENGEVIPFADDGRALSRAVVAALNDTDRLKRHVNPHKARITDVQTQADELWEHLHRAAGGRPAEAPAAATTVALTVPPVRRSGAKPWRVAGRRR